MAARALHSERGKAAAAVVLLHLALGWAIVTGLGVDLRRTIEEPLRVFSISEPPPPPEISVPAPVRRPDPEGAAAPPSLRSRPTPVVAPPQARRSPIRAAPEPQPAPTGSAVKAGASDIPGPGSGAGGEGSGAGSGRGGGGTGGGGTPTRAQRIGGSFDYSDHPDRGRLGRVETVGVRFLVGADGRVGDCTVTRSSGNSRLDSTTCRLIEQRFRYRPATDAAGRPVASAVSTVFSWIPDERRRRR